MRQIIFHIDIDIVLGFGVVSMRRPTKLLSRPTLKGVFYTVHLLLLPSECKYIPCTLSVSSTCLTRLIFLADKVQFIRHDSLFTNTGMTNYRIEMRFSIELLQ